MQAHAAAIEGDQIFRLRNIRRVAPDAHDRRAINAIIQELERRWLEVQEEPQ